MPDLAEDFVDALDGYDLADLESHGSSVCALRPDLTIAYRNPAWLEFARANGGADLVDRWPLGSRFLSAINEPLTEFYRARLELVVSTGQVWTHHYRCSSPTLYRRFRLNVYPLREKSGVLLVNSLVVLEPHSEPSYPPDAATYVDEAGLTYQCLHCRCFRRANAPTTWDFVPAWVERPRRDTSHGLCSVCHAHYFHE